MKSVLGLPVAFCVAVTAGLPLSAAPAVAFAQRPVPSDKSSLTPAQRKIDSQLLTEIDRLRTKGPANREVVRLDPKGRAYVDIRADVTSALEKQLKALGSTVVSTSLEFRSIVAWVSLKKLEQIAAWPTVYAIIPTPEPGIRK